MTLNPLKFMEDLYFKGYSMSQSLRLWREYKKININI